MHVSNAPVTEREYLEYHGSTIVERVQRASGMLPRREWLLFDSVEEAAAFYNENRTVV